MSKVDCCSRSMFLFH